MIPCRLAYHLPDLTSTYTVPLNLEFIALIFYGHLKVYFHKITPAALNDFLCFKLIFEE